MLPPLPGTGAPRRGLFISRWGALLQRGDSTSRSERRRLPPFAPALFSGGALDALFHVMQSPWSLYLVGNEDAVAHGHASDEDWAVFEAALLAHLASQGLRPARNYVCLDHPEGKGRHRRDSVFQFPNTGVFYHAAQEDGIKLAESWLVSDDVDELAAGWRSGVRIAGVRLTGTPCAGELVVEPHWIRPSLTHVLRELASTDEYARR
ncbi:MAG: hypothetical protein HZA53_12395 [Planctomycetes bacterium]|nr:hypothetical protein [Planctomycetota bacterium]